MKMAFDCILRLLCRTSLTGSFTSCFSSSGSSIEVYTNEEARCYYSLEDCSFPIEEGESMTSIAYALTHTIYAQEGIQYYVKCKDVVGNVNDIASCAAIVELN